MKIPFHRLLNTNLLLALLLSGSACQEDGPGQAEDEPSTTQTQFTQQTSSASGLDFNNLVEEQADLNYFIHSGFYNGAGLAAGDFNNDGLIDLFFSGNQVRNELYLNTGDLKFEKITDQAGLGGRIRFTDGSIADSKVSTGADISEKNTDWCTGATTVDINGDGYLDIYICRYFSTNDQQSPNNRLYLNNGDLTFTEKAAEFGIADGGNSVQATFLDYDVDGDLDLFVLNQPTGFRAQKDAVIPPNDWKDSDRLYRNEGNGKFVDVSAETGILNFAYGLSAVVGDVNNDGFPDIFVSNDYDEPDYLYFNKGAGQFTRIEDFVFKHLSNFSMGADIADFNNDGWLDIFVADMLAQKHYRQKTNMGAMNEANFWAMVDQGKHYQYMRNMLHLNNHLGSFSEIGQLAGVSKTDWSWAALFADFDNDGWKDLFVSNGILRDVRNNDAQKKEVSNTLAHSQTFPSTPLSNVLFRNNGDLTFENTSQNWGLSAPGFSNGAVYVDLDNDGDLDLVTNNVNSEAGLYRNNSQGANDYLQIELKGQSGNPRGRGAKVAVYTDQQRFYQEQTIERGYMSGMSGLLHFGLGKDAKMMKVEVEWPGGNTQTLFTEAKNSRLVLKEEDAKGDRIRPNVPNPPFIPRNDALDLVWKHRENPYNDLEKQVLLPHKLSTLGPGIAVGDINGDGNEEFYIGGASGQPGVLFEKGANGKFSIRSTPAIANDKSQEDMGVLFLDIDGDSDQDLYVVSGGNSFSANSPQLQDRLYLNDGKGNFTKGADRLPNLRSSGSCVIASDYDSDGDLDLFVGGRLRSANYPLTPTSYLLENDNGYFRDVTEVKAPGLQEIGMVSGGLWSDIDNDGQKDLLLVGEWMPLTIFKNTGGKLEPYSGAKVLDRYRGWWNSIVGGDFDKDGDIDYVVGNQGLNTKFHVSKEAPLELYSDDFDHDETIDIVLATHHEGETFPVRGRECSSQQIPEIEEDFKDFNSFASASLVDIYSKDKLDNAMHFQVTTFATSYIRNNGRDDWEVIPLPIQAQFSSVFGMLANDYDLDGNMDLLLTGNFYAPEVESGRQDAGIGVLLKGDGKGGFEYELASETGFFTPQDARSMVMLYDGIFPLFLVANNDGPLEAFAYVNATGKGSNFLPSEINAEMHFKDGSVQRFEKYLGSGYLSSSTNFIQIVPQTEKLVFFSADGTERVLK